MNLQANSYVVCTYIVCRNLSLPGSLVGSGLP